MGTRTGKRDSIKLSGRLSSFEDSEDDCDLRATSKVETYTISYMDDEVLNLTPWYEIDRSSQVLPTERKQTQTLPTHGVLLDKSSETTGYECEAKETYCEVKYDHSNATFEQSAYTRVMKVLSIMANHESLINWFSVDNPEGAEVLKITPHSPNVKKIIDSAYLKDKSLYLILLQTNDGNLVIEVWPMENLLIPKQVSIKDETFADKTCRICCDYRYFTLWCETTFLVFDINSTKLLGQFDLPFTCTAFALAPRCEAYLAADDGKVYKINLKAEELHFINLCPVFCRLPPVALTVYSQTINLVLGNMAMRMNMTAPSSGVKYYVFDKKRNTENCQFVPMEPRMFAILFKSDQVLFVFDMDRIISPLYRLDFTSAEHVVSACWAKNTLFTLTDLGVISRWSLLANGRKLREKTLDLKKTGCMQLIAVDYDKFLVASDRDTSAVKWNT